MKIKPKTRTFAILAYMLGQFNTLSVRKQGEVRLRWLNTEMCNEHVGHEIPKYPVPNHAAPLEIHKHG